ncbi:hypothetical protein HOD83_01785 [Candidatus Woesearchaeota archaeon]|jgi:hypothetical protein|nr:hypothetical protein [Candidatus Woesearchaeota archaeon]MBT4248299.1 hypothetical protein [Candidatus Woesearchaeota archaeon]
MSKEDEQPTYQNLRRCLGTVVSEIMSRAAMRESADCSGKHGTYRDPQYVVRELEEFVRRADENADLLEDTLLSIVRRSSSKED